MRRMTPNSPDPKVFADSFKRWVHAFHAAATIKNANGVRINASTKISPAME